MYSEGRAGRKAGIGRKQKDREEARRKVIRYIEEREKNDGGPEKKWKNREKE